MLALHGLGVSRGYAIGRAVVLGAAALEVSHYRIDASHVEAERLRLQHAFEVAQAEFSELIAQLPDDAPPELVAILNVHNMILSDPVLLEDTVDLIETRLYNAEWALATQGQLWSDQFSQMEDEYLRERGADVTQVIDRILAVLVGGGVRALTHQKGQNHDENLIVVAHDISPADMLKLRDARFTAICTDLGGVTSHTAIVARSMGVPAVVNLGNAKGLIHDGDNVIVDGLAGVVLVNPSNLVLGQYQALQSDYQQARHDLVKLRDLPAVTQDGVAISLYANIELPSEAALAFESGADGIGLLRSEFLFMGRATLPTEEEQYLAYSQALQAMHGKPVTIRTLDIGADKTLDAQATVATNPALGLRAVRYCLAHPDLFHTQLRALLRASVHGHLRILIPMVCTLAEANAVKLALSVAKASLQVSGHVYHEQVELGAMIEVPAAAIMVKEFIQHFDFMSIGTNDLTQYTLAIDRTDPEVAALFDPTHPAVLHLIAQTLQAGKASLKAVSVCGEMAGDIKHTQLLLGLGLTQFSMHPQQLLEVKQQVRQSVVGEC